MGVLDGVRDVRTIQQLLTGAEAEARSSGEDLPGPEHLLLAAASLPDGSAGRALTRVGIDLEQLRQAIERVHRTALATVGVEAPAPATAALQSRPTGAFRSTPQAQQVFQEAVALSKASTPSRLAGAHVLLATCGLERGTTARALGELGVDRERLRQAAREELGLR